MAGLPVFIDTAALLALLNADDGLHGAASLAYASLTKSRTPLVTSEWVMAEFLNGASRPPARQSAIGLLAALRSSPRLTLLPATHEWWERALTLYSARGDKSWSFVDCTTILACEERGIREVLTHDRHFEQAGLGVLMR